MNLRRIFHFHPLALCRLALVALFACSTAWTSRALAAPAPIVVVDAGASSSPAPPPLPHRPIIALATHDGAPGPLVLTAHDGAYVGELTIANEGGEPLTVSRIALRGDDEDVRAPARLSVHFAEGSPTSATIASGASKPVVVTWTPERNARMRQVFAHVVVTSNDEQAGEVAMGVHAQLASALPFVSDHLLSWITFLPLFGAALIVLLTCFGRGDDRSARTIALVVTALQLALVVVLATLFRGDVTRLDGNDGYQLVEHAVWVRSFDAEYFLGVDGVSMPMVMLTSLVSFIGCIASASIDKRARGYYALYLLLATGMMGVFVALDLLLFYVFWEVMLLPMYFLIGVWGGPRKEYAAIKFFLYTLCGSVFMLLAFLALYSNADRTFLVDGTTVTHTFSIPELARVSFAGKHLTIFGAPFVKVLWVILFLGFAIKIPVFPLHTWLPDAHVQAPTPISVLLAAVLLKMGAYGILRINFAILPDATRWAAGAVVAFGVVNVIYGALCAMAQDDLKRLVAYSSVSHMGFCLIGLGSLTPQGIAACLFQMVSHGVVTAMLFLLVGVLYDRVQTRSLRAFGGLASEMPLYAALSGLAFMASLGLPGLSGFWGEGLALLGAFPSYRALTTIAALGLVLSAAYNLGAFQRLFLGPFRGSWRTSGALESFGGRFPDVSGRELATIAPLAVICVVLGFWPVPLFALIAGGVRDVTTLVDPAGPDQIASLLHRASHALAMLPVTSLTQLTLAQSARYAIPEIALSIAALLVLKWDLFMPVSWGPRVRRTGIFVLALGALAISAFASARELTASPHFPLPVTLFEAQLTCDTYACAFRLFFAIVTAFVIVAAVPRCDRDGGTGDDSLAEMIALLLVVCLGMSLMAMARTLLLVYLAIEIVSVVSFILTAFRAGDRKSHEAALKYVVYGGVASGVMLYGMSWIYGMSQSLALSEIAERVASMTKEQGHLPNAFVIGVACVTAGFAYKIAAAPFHMWAPDVYEGAPTLVAAFLSVGPKAAGFALLVRFFREGFGAQIATAEPRAAWSILAGSLAIATMTIGNLSALAQTNMKRLLAYSSIAHAGTMLLAFAVFDDEGVAAIAFYLVAYCAMNLGAFLVVLAVGEASGGDESLDAFRGLGARAPAMAAALGIFLVSLVGLPPFAGFVGKLYVLVALLRAPGEYHEWYWFLACASVANTALSLFYYARVLRAMYLEPAPARASERVSVRRLHAALALILTVPTVLLGVWWGPLYDFVSQRVAATPP